MQDILEFSKNNYPFNYNQIFSQIYNILQIQLIKNVSSGNFFIDSVVHLLILSLLIYLITQIKYFFDFISTSINVCFIKVKFLFCYFYNKLFNNIVNKNVIVSIKNNTILLNSVEYNNYKVNFLYKSLAYFIHNYNNGIGYSELENNKKIRMNLYKIKFMGGEIKYNINFLKNFKDIKLSIKYNKKDINYINNFFIYCMNEYQNYLDENLIIDTYTNGDNNWSYEKSINNKKMENIILNDNIKYDVINDINTFLKSREFYNNLNLPFNKGYLFYQDETTSKGTGKETFIKGLALYFKRDIHFLSLQNINSEHELINLLNIIDYSKTILVVKDIHLLFNSSNFSNIINHDFNTFAITFDRLFEILLNINQISDRILILTFTDSSDKINKYIMDKYYNIFDKKIKFTNCSPYQFKQLYQLFYNKELTSSQLTNINTHAYSSGFIINIFIKNLNNPYGALYYFSYYENHRNEYFDFIYKKLNNLTTYKSFSLFLLSIQTLYLLENINTKKTFKRYTTPIVYNKNNSILDDNFDNISVD